VSELLRLEGAAFGYGARTVIAGVDLCVRAGDFIGIVGPNGSGKTTLFRGMLGLIRPSAGRVVRDPRPVGYVPQRDTLDAIYPLSVRDVVEMGAFGRLRGLRRLDRAERALAGRWLERVGLADEADAVFASLSGGQRQRALIARALLVDPALLLLDEPTSGVDQHASAQILGLLRELSSAGLAVLLVSHQLGLLRESVRQVLWVGDGRVQLGSPEELLRAEPFVPMHSAAGAQAPG
jgi:manganese/iron transport system ATP-binding protein